MICLSPNSRGAEKWRKTTIAGFRGKPYLCSRSAYNTDPNVGNYNEVRQIIYYK